MAGQLFLVGTPIGNLGDITLRAIETLRQVSHIYAEDTRRTKTLLSHLGIEGKKLLSFHAHSSERVIETALRILQEGSDVALVTDAGMPAVSDPGADLARLVGESGISMTVIPGPSAVTSAVALSGLVDGPFTFLGFLARKGQKRTEALDAIAQSLHPMIFFESPHRINATLNELKEVCGDERRVCICRELTKKFEETLRLTLAEITQEGFREEWLGELTIVVDRGERQVRAALDVDEKARQLLETGLSPKDVTSELLALLRKQGDRASRREIYARVQLLKEPASP